jgi:hypothetical protein
MGLTGQRPALGHRRSVVEGLVWRNERPHFPQMYLTKTRLSLANVHLFHTFFGLIDYE